MVSHRQRLPDERESALARTSRQRLARYTSEGRALIVQVRDSDQAETIELPASAVELLLEILGAIASGQGVTLIPTNAEVTTAQAADLLNVSRPFLIGLLEDGQIPYRKVGSHRRVQLRDVLNYKAAIAQEREAILDELVAQAQDEGMGY